MLRSCSQIRQVFTALAGQRVCVGAACDVDSATVILVLMLCVGQVRSHHREEVEGGGG